MNEAKRHKRTIGSRVPHPLWAAPLTVAVTFLIVGCYTILKHPIATDDGVDAEEASHQEYYRGQCLNCHQDYATYPYGFFYGEYPDYYFEYPRWGHYYAYPWWWDKLWYENADDQGTAGNWGSDSTGAGQDWRKATRRGGMVPPYVEGTPAVDFGGSGGYQTGGSTSGGGSGSQPGSGSAGSATPSAGLKSKSSAQPPTSIPTESGGKNQLREKSTQPASGGRVTPKGSTGSGTIETQKQPAGDSSATRQLEPKSRKK